MLIVGTGIRWGGQTTLAARSAIEQADRVLHAVADPFTARWIEELNPAAESLPYPRDAATRADIYTQMVERVLRAVRAGEHVCAVFYGHPGVFATPGHELMRVARAEGLSAEMLPGVSSLACMYADLNFDPARLGCQTYEATDWLLRPRLIDIHTPLVLLQIANIGNSGVHDPSDRERIRRGLELLAERLERAYGPAHQAVLYEAAILPTQAHRAESITIAELADATIKDITTLYIPLLERASIDPDMRARLASPNQPQEEST